MKTTSKRGVCVLVLLAAAIAYAQQPEVALNFVPSQTDVDFTLGDVLHTVHGNFKLKSGQIEFAPTTSVIRGQITVDAGSGNSGSPGRDRKMHKEVLESTRYSEVTFRPDRVEGKVAAEGKSAV